MNLQLPPRNDSRPAEAVGFGGGTPLVIIGANGAGKTRFTRSILDTLGDQAMRLNALGALYDRPRGDLEYQPWELRSRLSAGAPAIAAQQGATTLEMLLARLMQDEMLNLIGYKLALADGRNTHLKTTRLDKVVELWQEIFPGNRVLIDSGKILFSRSFDKENDQYTALRLSDGERAVLYYTGAVLYAPRNASIFVESPEIFLHPTIISSLWNRLEALRPDCGFCYTTHDPDFASSRNGARVVWVRDCDAKACRWNYEVLPPQAGVTNEIYLALAGSRKPVLFIEGDNRSIDARLYPLIFPDFTVRSLGSCNKVIEATRTFNDLASFHKLDSMGIVDRDRRNEDEVAYLRRKNIMVPEVAEVENIFILEPIVHTMASRSGADPDRVVAKVRKALLSLFKAELRQQALMHTRHRVKRTVEYRVDARFDSIDSLEKHLENLVSEMNPRKSYEYFCRQFQQFVDSGDYNAILKVFNQKSMLANCNVAQMCGFKNKDAYIDGVLALLRSSAAGAETVREAVRICLQSPARNTAQ